MAGAGKRAVPIIRVWRDLYGSALVDAGCPKCGGKLRPFCRETLWDDATMVYKCRDCGAVTVGSMVPVEKG